MKEEARFPYDQKEAAEEKLDQLRAKATKKLYFLQPVKEPLSDSAVAASPETEPTVVEDEVAPVEDDATQDDLDDDDDIEDDDSGDDIPDDDDDDIDDSDDDD